MEFNGEKRHEVVNRRGGCSVKQKSTEEGPRKSAEPMKLSRRTGGSDCSPIPGSLGRMYTPYFRWNPFSFPVPLPDGKQETAERAEWSDVSSACLCLTPRIFPLNFPDARIYHRSQSRKNLLRLCNAIPITIAPAGSCEMYRIWLVCHRKEIPMTWISVRWIKKISGGKNSWRKRVNRGRSKIDLKKFHLRWTNKKVIMQYDKRKRKIKEYNIK